jgi:hypothetical protein
MAVFVLKQSDQHCRVYSAQTLSELYLQKKTVVSFSPLRVIKLCIGTDQWKGVCVEIIATRWRGYDFKLVR